MPLLFLLSNLAWGQCPELDTEVNGWLHQHLEYLASDELKGRKPGTPGATKAGVYIREAFAAIKLRPVDGSYYQKFMVPEAVAFDDDKNQLMFDGRLWELFKDYFPAQWSTNGRVKAGLVSVGFGIEAPELGYNDYEEIGDDQLDKRVVVMDISSPDGIHPHSKYLKYHDLGERILKARKKGAAAVVLVNLGSMASDLQSGYKNIQAKGLPVVFVTNNELAAKLQQGGEVSLQTGLRETEVEAYNVVAELDHGAKHTVLIGAHYDHLGMGGENSLYRGEEAIHNGADDNASGVAAMLEIARYISENPKEFPQYNFRFVAFSAEEMGLLGSAHFTKNTTVGKRSLRYMINLDMVGRMEDSLLAINGVGTSAAWPELLEKIDCYGLKLKTSKSGVGPSDHTNFYHQKIPVLHFFTGTHSDYHKPSDDVDKINFAGMESVVGFILELIKQSAAAPDISFTETPTESLKAPSFSVTLGVMPDYMYDGEGMRIDGVSPDKPAARAELQQGDVITRLGEVKVVDMMSYMKALGQFKKGDTAEVEFQRDGKTLTATLQF